MTRRPSPCCNSTIVVSVNNAEAGFSEISGLTLEYETVKYRQGFSEQPGEPKMPGRRKVNEVYLKKGVFTTDNSFYKGGGRLKLLPGLTKPDIIEATAVHCPGWGNGS